MSFLKVNQIDKVWANICKYEGELFYTQKRKKPFTYVVKDNYIIINNDAKRGRITIEKFEKALIVANPIPKKIGGWAPSYICGIITDTRIVR